MFLKSQWDILIQKLVKSNLSKTPYLIRALKNVPRSYFIPEIENEYSVLDLSLPIRENQTVSG